MEECEALCTRLAIMVNGRFKCLGSIQHLKSRFGDGYTVSLRLKGPNYDHSQRQAQRFIQQYFPEADIKECHYNLIQLELKCQDIALSYVFSKLEEAQKDLNIEDYSVSQNNLDNVSYILSLLSLLFFDLCFVSSKVLISLNCWKGQTCVHIIVLYIIANY